MSFSILRYRFGVSGPLPLLFLHFGTIKTPLSCDPEHTHIYFGSLLWLFRLTNKLFLARIELAMPLGVPLKFCFIKEPWPIGQPRLSSRKPMAYILGLTDSYLSYLARWEADTITRQLPGWTICPLLDTNSRQGVVNIYHGPTSNYSPVSGPTVHLATERFLSLSKT